MANVVFRSSALCDRCTDFDMMAREWGLDGARLVRRKLQQLAAVVDLDDLSFLPGVDFHQKDGQMQIYLQEGMLMVVSAGSQSDTNPKANYEKLIVVEKIRVSKRRIR